MRKFILALPIIFLALCPPVEVLHFSPNVLATHIWIWFILIGGFFGFYTLFLDINKWLKAISLYLFVSCFFSSAPYLSFISYITFVLCLYYYIACLKLNDWSVIKKSLVVILVLNILLIIMQRLGFDSLTNFGLQQYTCFGIIGNPMCLRSFIIILAAILFALYEPCIKNKTLRYWVYYLVVVFGIVFVVGYIFEHHVLQYIHIRLDVWHQTILLTNYKLKTLLFGWGQGEFKHTFMQIATLTPHARVEGQWLSPHNCWLQILFETGIIGFLLILSYAGKLVERLYRAKLWFCFIAALMIGLDMCVHFPTRDSHSVLIMIAFMAFCEIKIKEQKH